MTDQADLIYERLLVVRAQAGDDGAFAELVERFSPRLRYFLRKLLGPERRGGRSQQGDDAEDALQDVWVDVIRSLPRLNDPQALVAWLYRIARDRAFARLRKAKPHEQLRDEGTVADTTTDDDRDFSPEDADTHPRRSRHAATGATRGARAAFFGRDDLRTNRRRHRLQSRHRAVKAALRQASIAKRAGKTIVGWDQRACSCRPTILKPLINGGPALAPRACPTLQRTIP